MKFIRLAIIVMAAVMSAPTLAIADDDDRGNRKNRCDVVAINGTAKFLPDGRLIGSEVITNIANQKTTPVEFTMITLGTTNIDQATGTVTLSTSHDFKSTNNKNVNFTTFDEIHVFPLGGTDSTCVQNACGLVFKLKLENGHGRYNCGEIVSGYNPDPVATVPFTSYVDPFNPTADGDFVFLNSLAKLCSCSGNY